MSVRVLVVEDNADKLRQVLRALGDVSGCTQSDIDNVRDLVGARRLLRDNKYDLLILDIAVPVRVDEEPLPNAGIALLDELQERDALYKVPNHIIGLTAHEDIVVSANDRFAKDLWSVVRYRDGETDWQERLQRRLTHIVQASLSGAGSVAIAEPEVHCANTLTLIHSGEGDSVEFKATLRWNQRVQKNDPTMELMVLKTIAAFLNTSGGTLVIGVSDAGEVLGMEADHFANDDQAMRHVTSLVRDRISNQHMRYLKLTMDMIDSRKVLRVDCMKARTPAYVRTEKGTTFFIRTGPATAELPVSEIHSYIETWFPR